MIYLKILNPKSKKKMKPTGFILDFKNIYISTNLGRLIIVNLEDASIKEILKIGNSKISRPFVKNNNLFLIKNDSIIKLN